MNFRMPGSSGGTKKKDLYGKKSHIVVKHMYRNIGCIKKLE